jgi:hypothetical protein
MTYIRLRDNRATEQVHLVSKIRRILLLVLLAILTAGCGGTPGRADAELAEAALRAYFTALHEGRFEEGVAFYAGDYVGLEANNPDVASSDYALLLERWCRQNGGVCLPIETVVDRQDTGQGGFSFVVRFVNDDGTTFEIGPCCGAEDTGERVREFTYTVVPGENGYVVLELPPYVP